MRSSFRTLCALALLSLLAAAAHAQVVALDRVASYDSGLGEGAAEIVVHDAGSQRLFVVNAVSASVDVIDVADPLAPSLVTRIDVSDLGDGANSVAVANGLVAVAVEAEDAQADGLVAFFDVGGVLLGTVEVGALPDMVTFTPAGTKVLVANEGEPDDDYQVDPEGSVSIIDVSGGVAAATVETVGFADFNDGGPRAGELSADVRIFGPGASVAQDLEPEYVVVSDDGATAWVALQENNALAVIDVPSATVLRIDPLGFKDHSLAANAMDASNEDDGIDIRTWPTLGMYQPDAIAAYRVGDVTYVVTANEGDARDYDGFSEEERVEDLTLDPTAFPDAATLQLDENLGRLKTTTTLGDVDDDGDYDEIYSYGGRSFSIWNGATGAQVFDSANDFETITADQVPALFNSQGDAASFDSRSDDKGPEPEGVVVGQVGDRLYAFVGLERIGGIMVYDVTNPSAAQFVLYQPNPEGDVSPEGLYFVPAGESPTTRALLLVSNEVSGTVSIYQIRQQGEPAPGDACQSDATTLCLVDGRFRVRATYVTDDGSGDGQAEPLLADSGGFTFFEPENLEVLVKVLDACTLNDRFWVFASGLTNVGVEIEVTDVENDVTEIYGNDLGTDFELISDTDAFAGCP